MTPTNHIIDELDKQIEGLQTFRTWVMEQRAVLDSSGDKAPYLYGVDLHLFLHAEPPSVVKPLARDIGGAWIRQSNTNGSFDWVQKVCGCNLQLRFAEPKKQEPSRLDIVDLSEPEPEPDPIGPDPFDRTDESAEDRKERIAMEKADHDNDLAKSNSL